VGCENRSLRGGCQSAQINKCLTFQRYHSILSVLYELRTLSLFRGYMQTKASQNYRASVYACASGLIEQGGFTVKDFAEKCGFRVTRHLRNHLRAMVEQGIVQATEAYTDGGRLATFYHKPVPTVQNQPLPHPF
jgi:hypothetical protein